MSKFKKAKIILEHDDGTKKYIEGNVIIGIVRQWDNDCDEGFATQVVVAGETNLFESVVCIGNVIGSIAKEFDVSPATIMELATKNFRACQDEI